MNHTYLSVTTTMSDQKNSDNTPSTFASVMGTGAWLLANTSLSAYRGLVPMSPYTTPKAAKVSAAWVECAGEVSEVSDAVEEDMGTQGQGRNR